jgi:hypothetical protein
MPKLRHYFSTSPEKSTFWPRRVGNCRALMFCYFFIKKKVKERKGKPDFSVASQARLHRNDLIVFLFMTLVMSNFNENAWMRNLFKQ